MSAEQVSLIAGVILSLAFSYVPKLKDWFDKQEPDNKRLINLGVLFVVVLGVFGLSCINKYDYLTCDVNGLWDGLELLIKAAIANQAAYSLTPRGDEAEG